MKDITNYKAMYMSQFFADNPDAGQDPAKSSQEPQGEAKKTEAKTDAKAEEKANGGALTLSDSDLARIVDALAKRQQQAQSEAEKLAKMSAQERAEHERDELQKELDKYKRQQAVADMEKTARRLLKADGIVIGDDLVGILIAEDAERTKARVEAFSRDFKAAVQEGVKDALRGKAPASGAGGGSKLSREEIMKVSNRSERQRLISENLDLFR